MCSRDSCSDESTKPNEKINLVGASCRKCTTVKASVVLQGKFPYCRQCFLAYFSHKFNAVLGKSKIMKSGDKILLAFSGSPSSICLLDLVQNYIDERRRKKISTSAVLLYIEEAFLFDKTPEERSELLNEIYNALLLYDFKTFYASYDSFFDEEIMLYKSPSSLLDSTDNSRMSKLLEDCTTDTAKIDLLVKAKNDVLVKAARWLQCNKIFLADTSDHIAVNVISNVSLGRGSQLVSDIGFCDDRFGDILFIRPLQDCSKKEVAYFNVFNDLRSITIPSFGTKDDKFSSIQKLTETFVNQLKTSFPSTVPTVVSTGNKLTASENGDNICRLCHAKVESNTNELSAQHATTVSGQISNLGPNAFESSTFEPLEEQSISDKNGCCGSPENNVSQDQLSEYLCYGCRLILKDSKSTENWPSIIKTNSESQIKEMEDEIKKFLID
ncbi:cytoplasmic tRNA 2-thiolation protein 2 [Cimex lectularius]|uniref:Cytoplasmic tRNA 2-thiolation protein 2 n=1 Tax=Cimex lectularius TaxID=79782 RepID=A0A8I6SCY9_CIMLE|nr:cytoplasmic tRNA 2-thiolation protein 2 [Cimex lectularius]